MGSLESYRFKIQSSRVKMGSGQAALHPSRWYAFTELCLISLSVKEIISTLEAYSKD